MTGEGRSLDELLAQLDDETYDDEIARQVEAIVAVDTVIELPELATAESDQELTADQHQDIRQIVGKAKLPQKIKLAMFGNAICRGLLIRDANRMVQEFVLKNPRLQAKEIEDFTKNPNTSQFVLRTVAGNQQWMKGYAVKLNLVSNPKTPGDLALKWMRFLSMVDLKKLSKSKNVPQVVSNMARRKVQENEGGR